MANAKQISCSDSSVVLGYIANDAKKFHVFVANRVQQIRNNTSSLQGNYVNTKNKILWEVKPDCEKNISELVSA